MSFSERALAIFNQSVAEYHISDDVDQPDRNPFESQSLEHILYAKNWIDTVQWHLEDIIRDENISPETALLIKRRIDASNQKRTDLVEDLDFWFLQQFQKINALPSAKINTETPAWAMDRLSILALKIYHMQQETIRESATKEHKDKCMEKLNVLSEQKNDLCLAIDQLLDDIGNGKVRMKLYKQMKMYNDESLNPILYQNAKK